LAGLLLAVAGVAHALEVLVPVDGSLAREKTVALVVRPNSPDLRVSLNDIPVEPFSANEGYKDFAHGALELEAGENRITVRLGEERWDLRVELRPYQTSKGKKERHRQRQRFAFHLDEREESCLGCHPMSVDEPTRKPKRREDSICAPCHGEMLQASFVHGPVGAFACMACHQETPSEDFPRYAVLARESEHCDSCHKTKRRLAEKKYIHGPLAVGLCVVCHDPHGSSFKFQLHRGKEQLCYSCHVTFRAVAEDPAVLRHRAIDEKGCAACHDPHGSAEPLNLQLPLDVLCLSCHEKDRQGIYSGRNHPVENHPTGSVPDPLKPGELLKCTSCHDPHFGKNRGLLRASSYLDLCLQCHQK